MKVIAIIPAAGLGTRMAGPASVSKGGAATKTAPSKQFLSLSGEPILVHTLRKFAAVPQVTEIYVALRPTEREQFEAMIANAGITKPIRIAEGGEHRQHSVANALAAVDAADDDIVLVHDAVRPFVTPETITSVIEAVERHGAAIAGVPAIDTIKQVERTAEGAVITTTVPRERAVLAQTPQGFRYALLRNAMTDAMAEGFLGTDEASLLERVGQEVAVVMGSQRNIKITTPSDLDVAELYMSHEAQKS